MRQVTVRKLCGVRRVHWSARPSQTSHIMGSISQKKTRFSLFLVLETSQDLVSDHSYLLHFVTLTLFSAVLRSTNEMLYSCKLWQLEISYCEQNSFSNIQRYVIIGTLDLYSSVS